MPAGEALEAPPPLQRHTFPSKLRGAPGIHARHPREVRQGLRVRTLSHSRPSDQRFLALPPSHARAAPGQWRGGRGTSAAQTNRTPIKLGSGIPVLFVLDLFSVLVGSAFPKENLDFRYVFVGKPLFSL